MDLEKAESELKGTTLRIYWQVFRAGKPVGVREAQRAVGLASPSTALYHLDKLREIGVIRKDEYGQYEIVEDVKVGIVKNFFRIGKIVLPRYLFYAVFFLTAVIAYLTQSALSQTPPNPMALILGVSAVITSWYELSRVWRDRLF